MNGVKVIGGLPALGSLVNIELRRGQYVAFGASETSMATAGGITMVGASSQPDNLDHAPFLHALSGENHTGTLADIQAPQFLKTDGSRMLTGDLGVTPGATIDGYDVSAIGASIAQATWRGQDVTSPTLLKTNADGYLGLGAATIGKKTLNYDPANGWRQGTNLSLVANEKAAFGLATRAGVTGITSDGERLNLAPDFGFGSGTVTLSGAVWATPYGGGLGVNQFPSAPLTGAGETEQLRLINTTAQRFTGFTADESGNLTIAPQGGKTTIAGQTKTQHLITDTASVSRLRAGSLLVDRQSVLCGETIAAERGAFVAFDFTVPVAGQGTSLIIEEPVESTANVFRDGAYILLSKIIWTDSTTYIRKKCWGKVTFRRRLPGGSPPMQEYVFIRDATIPGDLEAGEIIAHDGPSNIATQFGKDSGLYMITTTGGTSTPSVVIYSWTGHPENPTNLKKQLETSSNKVIVSDLTFTGNGISTSFGPKLYFGAYSGNQYYYAVGIETQVSEAADYGGAAVFMKAWDYGRTDWCGIVADRSIFEKRLSFNADTYTFANTAHLYSSGFVFHAQTSFEKMLRLPAVEAIPHPFGYEYNSRLRIDVSSHDPLVKADGDLWLLLSGLKFHLNGATRNILAPSSIPVLPTGAGKTVDNVIAALQAIGAVTQT